MIASASSDFKDLQEDEASKESAYDTLVANISSCDSRLSGIRAKQFSSSIMAEKITGDLASVYGKSHLAIELSQDGQHYFCRREGEPAKHLSEGERNTLALIYFLRRLEDKAEDDISPKNRLVVIDDPSSSLDREAVFATHSWLLDALHDYGQTIILTHDFELFRLLRDSQNNQLRTHNQILRDTSSPKSAEQAKRFPQISFLEMRSIYNNDDQRKSLLEPVSEVLLKYNSEYHYLFDRVLSGLEKPNDHETLFLLPNAARRILETFASFHAPNQPNFLSQMKKLAIEDKNSEYRDVYDFCNRYSHGEGRETTQPLDVRVTHHQIRRAMEFMRDVDGKHYKEMCTATGRTSGDPLDA